ncbi:DENND2 [Mytilus coruscus]|uniref:DENND2 n=1 Tax=Mytilus coruscus TaxID=42192 RepID=A0A6J8A325_MYTCO|nr:DENND2 [Mytilus coruscus]
MYSFFKYLDLASMKLLHKDTLSNKKHDSVKNALGKLATCKALRKHFLEALQKCQKPKIEASQSEKIFILQELVEKYMHSRQKSEIKRYNFQPKKMSATTRGLVKTKCLKKNRLLKTTTKRKYTTLEEKEHTLSKQAKLITTNIDKVQSISKIIKPKQSQKTKDIALSRDGHIETTPKKYSLIDIKDNPHLLIGSKIKHKWKMNKKRVHLNGEITGLTKNETKPDDSDTEERKNEHCFDVVYLKYKKQTYHYRLLPDIASKDLKIVAFSDNKSELIL